MLLLLLTVDIQPAETGCASIAGYGGVYLQQWAALKVFAVGC
jgi:hypothetical protein